MKISRYSSSFHHLEKKKEQDNLKKQKE